MSRRNRLSNWLIGIVVVLILATGCAPKVAVRPVDPNQRYQDLDRSAINSNQPSERTLLFLRQRDLLDPWEKDPLAILTQIDASFRQAPEHEAVFALMELCYLQARKTQNDEELRVRLFLSSAYYAYSYLFDAGYNPPPSPYHPHSRLACALYNRSLAAYLIYFRDSETLPEIGMRLPLVNGQVVLETPLNELPWKARDFDRFFISYEFEVEGLELFTATYGIGVPIIAQVTPPAMTERRKTDQFLPKVQQSYAATVFLRFKESLVQPGDDDTYPAAFELYDLMKRNEIEINGRPVPLETDLTTPLAHMVENAEMPAGITGMLQVESWSDRSGLYMLQPYDPEKIPVVFVHGLMSSPETWLSMFNSLLGDPLIRQRFQFWFFMYPTGNPILYSASTLRESLMEVRQIYNPDGDKNTFDQMVLVGHSMGGLLSRLMVSDSGDILWNAFSEEPFENFDLRPEGRRIAENVFFFDPLPFVSRVIFIATPHRGSNLASNQVGRLGTRLISLPRKLLGLLPDTELVTGKGLKIRRIPTGIDGLAPDSYFMTVTVKIPMSDRVVYHSIIGNNKVGDTPGGTDGVVPYESSHMDVAQTEVIVHSGHSAHRHPLAIAEVRRILREHVK